MHFYRASCCISTEIRVGQHGHYRSMVEETDCFVGQLGYINQCVGIGVAVN